MKKHFSALILFLLFISVSFSFVNASNNIFSVDQLNSKILDHNRESVLIRSYIITLSHNTINENERIGVPVGDFDILSYSQPFECVLSSGVGDEDNGSFYISQNRLFTGELFDFEYRDTYSIHVSCSGEDMLSEKSFDIYIIDQEEFLLSNNLIAENQPTGTFIGSLQIDDDLVINDCLMHPNMGDDFSFTFSEDWELFSAEVFDFEYRDKYVVHVECGGYVRAVAVLFSTNLSVYITNQNESPTFISSPTTVAIQGDPYTCDISATDPDFDDTLSISANIKPDWVSFSDNGNGTAILTGTPSNDHVGDNAVELRVTDFDGLSSTQSFNITVENINDAPNFTSEPKDGATQGELYNYNIFADDPDLDYGETLTLTAPTLPDWLDFSQVSNEMATLLGVPDNSDVGDHYVELLVTDELGATDTQNFTISVTQVNDPPVFTSTPITIAYPNIEYNYEIIVLDPDQGDTIDIIAITKPNWLLLMDNGDGTAMLSGTPDESHVGEHDVVLKATDDYSLYDLQDFSIIVSEDNFNVFLPLIQK